MKKYLTSFFVIGLLTGLANAQQTNFSGNWIEPELEMLAGIRYSNAVPKGITVTQTKDSIKIMSLEVDDNNFTQTIALNGETALRIGKTSKRTIRTKANWSNNGRTLTIVTTYGYVDNPDKAEYTNIEVWNLSLDGNLVIEKTSDADVTDDWIIKATYSKG
ncbi:MAG TPA: hypothetical protein VI461_18050 [Chitinophagaceae bacterium]|nr:hypothetical protein [Chitinophagaceae bacterium]